MPRETLTVLCSSGLPDLGREMSANYCIIVSLTYILVYNYVN